MKNKFSFFGILCNVLNQSDPMVKSSMDSFLAYLLCTTFQLISYVDHLDWVHWSDWRIFTINFSIFYDRENIYRHMVQLFNSSSEIFEFFCNIIIIYKFILHNSYHCFSRKELNILKSKIYHIKNMIENINWIDFIFVGNVFINWECNKCLIVDSIDFKIYD